MSGTDTLNAVSGDKFKTLTIGDTTMKRFYPALIGILFVFLIAFPVFAQDSIPTPETVATEVPAPTADIPSEDVHNAVDDVIEAVTSNLPIIFMGIALLMAVMKIKEPQSRTEYEAAKREILRLREEAKKTETKVDDVIAEARNLVNEMRGISGMTISQPDPTPPVTTPPFVPVPVGDGTIDVTAPATTAFMDVFGKRGSNSYTWQKTGHAQAVIEIPDGYDYRNHNFDANGTEQPYKAVNTNPEYGTRLNVAFVAGKHSFIRTKPIFLGTGKHEIALSYVADVKDTEGGQPMHNWLWAEAQIDSQPVLIGTDTINHRALKNGTHVATWIFTNDTPREVALSFVVNVHWASAKGDSTIDLKAFGLKQA
jgi:hypothetical protein